MKNDKTLWNKANEPKELLDKICSSDCNKNGQCVSGACQCNYGFTGFDCSINMNQRPKLINIVSSTRMCNFRKFNNCSKLILYGENFSNIMDVKLTVFDLFEVGFFYFIFIKIDWK